MQNKRQTFQGLRTVTRWWMRKLGEARWRLSNLQDAQKFSILPRKADGQDLTAWLSYVVWVLSAADTRWTDLLRILAKLIDKKEYTDKELKDMDWENRTTLVRAVPVTCARFFGHRLQLFLNHVLESDLHPTDWIKDSFVYTEFQQRGSPHAHIMFWIHEAPKVKKKKLKKKKLLFSLNSMCLALHK